MGNGTTLCQLRWLALGLEFSDVGLDGKAQLIMADDRDENYRAKDKASDD